MNQKKKTAEVIPMRPEYCSTLCAMLGEKLIQRWMERGHQVAKGESMNEVAAANTQILQSLGEADAVLVLTLTPRQQEQEGKPVYVLHESYFGPTASQLTNEMTGALRTVFGNMSALALKMTPPATKKRAVPRKKKAAKKKPARGKR